MYGAYAEAKFWTKQTKVSGVVLLAFHNHLYFFKLTPPLTISTLHLLYTVREKGGKPDGKPYPLHMV